MSSLHDPGMRTVLGLAYAGYLAWLAAGCADFVCHRRTDLSHTSGLRESTLHLAQLVVIGATIVLCLVLHPSAALAAVCAALVGVHAGVGYLDTRQAYGRRVLGPFEQHVHSVLDMAPILAFLLYFGTPWVHGDLGAGLALRSPPLPPAVWAAVLLPAALLCVVPALLEFRAALDARVRRA